jgi:hypothetical protein
VWFFFYLQYEKKEVLNSIMAKLLIFLLFILTFFSVNCNGFDAYKITIIYLTGIVIQKIALLSILDNFILWVYMGCDPLILQIYRLFHHQHQIHYYLTLNNNGFGVGSGIVDRFVVLTGNILCMLIK